MKLGSSQQAVLDLLKYDSVPRTAQQVGDSLYTKISSCAKYGDGTGSMGGKTTPEDIRRLWAAKLLNKLRKADLVDFTKQGNEKFWKVVEK